MPHESCSLPGPADPAENLRMLNLLRARRIAVVGASNRPGRASYDVIDYLLDAGKEVIPVNPNHSAILGMKCHASLEEVPGKIDLVNVFRRPEACADIVRQAIKVGAKGIWLQSGIRNDEARQLAEEAGVAYIEDRCLMVEHMRMVRGRA
jgi:uncharacterized protein